MHTAGVSPERQTQIYLEYRDKVSSYVRGKVSDPHEVEDLVSTAFLKIFQKLDAYDPERAGLSTWIYTIVHNTVVDYYRTHRNHLSYDDAILTEWKEPSVGDPDQVVMLEQLADALQHLKERERDLIVLHYYEGYTLKQAAETMGMSYINAKVVHKKALSGLRNYFLTDG